MCQSQSNMVNKNNRVSYDGMSVISNINAIPNTPNMNSITNSSANTPVPSFGNFDSNFDNFENMSMITNFTVDWNQFSSKRL